MLKASFIEVDTKQASDIGKSAGGVGFGDRLEPHTLSASFPAAVRPAMDRHAGIPTVPGAAVLPGPLVRVARFLVIARNG
jgi:hypothetical protein